MADKHISDLDQGNALQGGELIPMDQNTATRVTSPLALLTYILANINTGQIAESINLFFTNARADARVAIHANRTDNPHSVSATQLGLANVQNTKHNYGATTDPLVTHDSSAGYSIGSVWVNVSSDTIFLCTDASLGSALWRDITNVSVDKAFVGLGNVENTALSTWAGSSNITTIALAAITAWLGSIDHNALLNYSSNRHIDHSSVNITAGEGLTGGGSLLASRTLAMNVPGLTAFSGTIDSALDQFIVYDASAGGHRACKLTDMAGYGRLLRLTVITVSSTWSPGADTKSIYVEIVGGGGGGGGASNTASADTGGGGGAGGYAAKYITTPGATETVTIGAGGTAGVGATPTAGGNGGTTSFGAWISATGGTGGGYCSGATISTATGGTGGLGSSGDINSQGGQGRHGFNSAFNESGTGGSSYFGAGGASVATPTNAVGNNGVSPGSGGSGGCTASSGGNKDGGTGAAGYCLVWEFS